MKPIPCPTCKKIVDAGEEQFPFCSERCRLIDLGNWLDGRYRVAGEPVAGADGNEGRDEDE